MQTNPTILHTAPSGRVYRLVGIEQLPQTNWISHWRTLVEFHDDMSKAWLYYDDKEKFLKLEKFL